MYIACAGERLLLLEVEYRERSGRNNRSDLTKRFGPYQVVSEQGCSRHCGVDDWIIMEAKLWISVAGGRPMEWTFSYSCCGTREIMCYDNDQMTLINVAAIEMVEKLEIPITLRAQPYSFLWVMKSSLSRTSPRYRFCWENIFVRFYAT